MTDIHNIESDSSALEPVDPPTDKVIVNLANRLLQEFNISYKIEDVGDISASLFVVLYESLFSDRLPGIIRQPVSKEDEIHNCQIVIDVLSTEVVKDSLSHIRGTDIVEGDNTAILNLLDIFSYLLEYVVKRIENEAELNDTGSVCTTDAEQSSAPLVTSQGEKFPPQMVKDIPKSKLGSPAASNMTNNNSHLVSEERGKMDQDRNDNRKAFSCRDVITHEDFYAMSYGGIPPKTVDLRPPSPIRADESQSLLGQKTVDSDFDTDLIEISEPEKRVEEPQGSEAKIAWEPKSSRISDPTDTVIDGVTLRAKKQPSKYAPWESSAYSVERPIPSFSASMPAPRTHAEEDRTDLLRRTVGPISYHSQTTPGESKYKSHVTSSSKGLSSSYNDLRELVERTAALTRVALATSPVRAKTATDYDVSDYLSERPRPVISSTGARFAKELNSRSLSANSKDPKSSTKKPSKKVAFASTGDSGLVEAGLNNDDRGFFSGWQTSPGQYLNYGDFNSRDKELSSGTTSPAKSASQRLQKPKSVGQKKTSTKTGREQQFAKYLARNRQPELGAAQMTLRKEDKSIRDKQELLQKFYEQDHQEFADDVEYILERDREKSTELEEECIKKCAESVPKKKVTRAAKVSTSKRPRVIKSVHRRPSHNTKGKEPTPSASMPLCINSEEDLLPALLEEFPHLHLSEHTWHELWRKGLQQIESLTRSHQESKRKKSRAQCQLEEAAERHELLADLMKKQLDHTKRLRDIKEQKQQQIATRNKMHEKRIQSARARRYYNEYQVRARSKQLKRRTKEEMVFRDLFKDALNIQKERIKDVRQYATDQRKVQESRRQDEIDSLENFYHDQFLMLTEKLAKERMETQVRDAAQKKIMQQLKRELRKKMESEINQYQEQLFQDDDDVHFRMCDADRVLKQLHLAKYSAKI